MGPELWLLLGAVGVFGCLGLGFWAGYAVGGAPVTTLELQLSGALARIEALLEQDEADVEAARIVVRTERELAAVAAGGPSARARLWLHGSGARRPGPSSAPSGPTGAPGGGRPELVEPSA